MARTVNPLRLSGHFSGMKQNKNIAARGQHWRCFWSPSTRFGGMLVSYDKMIPQLLP